MSRYSKNLGVFVLCLLFLGNSLLYSQDTLKVVKIKKQKHSPLVATLMSTAVPGLGQIYNKKYWKTPIIYVGFGVLTYFFITNYDEYSIYRNEYLYRIKGDTSNLNVSLKSYSQASIILIRDYYRRNVELTVIISAVWYVLNILDATVDAHLFTYDISDNLSLKIEPDIKKNYNNFSKNYYSGIKLTLKF